MNEKLIKKQYLKKISDLRKHNQAYYDKSAPLIADTDYDKLKNDIINYEKKYKFLKNQNSPSLLVGFRPSKNFKKIKHKVPMLSLSNAFDEEDLINFEKRITNYLENVRISINLRLDLKKLNMIRMNIGSYQPKQVKELHKLPQCLRWNYPNHMVKV